MSISIPVMFPSVKYKNNYYLDGGLYDQIGIYKIKSKNIINNNVIVISYINKNNDIISNDDNKIYELVNYVSNCTYTYVNESTNNNKNILLKNYKYFYCYTNIISNDFNNLFFNLTINDEKKVEMINNGYNYAINKNL